MPLKLGRSKNTAKTQAEKKADAKPIRKKATRRRREEEEVEELDETEEDPGLDENDEEADDPDISSDKDPEEEEEEQEEELISKKTSKKTASKSSKSSVGSFLRRGKAAREAREKEVARQAQREQDGKGSWRFWMNAGEEKQLIFLDGDLEEEDDMLDIPYVYEHNVPYEGRFKDVRCVAQNEDENGRTEPCPICESGHAPAYVGFMTVLEILDGSTKDRDGNKVHYRKRLYPVKIKTGDLLQKRALKLKEKEGTNGLTGWLVEVSRSNKQCARVGDYFDFEKHLTKQQIQAWIKKKGGDPKDAEPCDYSNETELKWRDRETLINEGFVKDPDSGGATIGGKKSSVKKKNLADELG